ncbi:hypothetical protein WME91_07650 [Sorangium sp. So ce269]
MKRNGFRSGLLFLIAVCAGTPACDDSTEDYRDGSAVVDEVEGPLDGRHSLQMDMPFEIESKDGCDVPGGEPGPTFRFVAALHVDGQKADGWISLVAPKPRSMHPVSIHPNEVQGRVEGSTIELAPVEVSMSDEDILAIRQFRFDTASLTLTPKGEVSGRAAGVFLPPFNDRSCQLPFTAEIVGGPDRTKPGAWLLERQINMPFDPLTIATTEPVEESGGSVSVLAGDAPVAATVEGTSGPGDGFVSQLALVPVPSWPAGTSLSIDLWSPKDAAGNVGNIALGPIPIATRPDSIKNLGFESGLVDWLTDWLPSDDPDTILPVHAVTQETGSDKDGDPYVVLPVEGSTMASILVYDRLVGYLEPPSGATRLKLSAGFIDPDIATLQKERQGLEIKLIVGRDRSVVADGGTLPAVADPKATWTGFHPLLIDLPTNARHGFWIVVSSINQRPVAGLGTKVLLDGLSFE